MFSPNPTPQDIFLTRLFEEPLVLDLPLPALAGLSAPRSARPVAGRLADAIDQITRAHAEACATIPALLELEEKADPA